MTALHGRLVSNGRSVRVSTGQGRITAVEDVPGSPPCWIAPGMVDIQVNGYGGLDFNGADLDVEDVAALVAYQWEKGVTAICPTLVSGPEERAEAALAVIATARRHDGLVRHAIPCVHVEGPYLSPEDGPRGAHDRSALRLPDQAELDRWQRAGEGAVGIVTLAPELEGALAYTRAAAAAGVVVSIGHSAASVHDISAAADAGAQLSTHLGNGCHLQLPRHPNHIWAQLAEDRLHASFIADGHHLPPSTFKAMVRAKTSSRSVLVSDSVALAGSPPGRYRGTPVGDDVTLSEDGRLCVTGTDVLAGSVRCLPECLGWAVAQAGVSVADAVRMASINPYRLLRLSDRGAVQVGATADLTVFELDEQTGAFRLDATVVAGKVVGRAEQAQSLAGN